MKEEQEPVSRLAISSANSPILSVRERVFYSWNFDLTWLSCARVSGLSHLSLV